MVYVYESISAEDRKRFDLDQSDNWLALAVPARQWVIDRNTETFIRLLRLYGRKKEPGDPDAHFDRDFHFHWNGRDFVIYAKAAIQLEDYEGRQFGDLDDLGPDERVAAYWVLAISELVGNSFNRRFGIECQDAEFFNALRQALLYLNLGLSCHGDWSEIRRRGRVVLKISNKVEVV